MAKKTRSNKFDVEWQYAKACWTALVSGSEVPPVPFYFTWEHEEYGGREELVGKRLISPKRVSFGGKTLY